MSPEELLTLAERADAAYVAGVKHAVHVGVVVGAQTARLDHKFKNRSHTLVDSIKERVLSESARGAIGEIRADAPYASFVDEGTAPHVIEARRVEFLRFMIGGRVIFARSVNHPGTRPDGFMGNAALAAEREMELEVRRGNARAAEILNGG